MLDADRSPVFQPRRRVGLKIMVIATCGLVLSFGLCGVGFYLGRNIHDGAPSGFDILGGLAFLLSVIALAVGVLIAILEAIYISSDKRKP
jgi:hypothetical protein